MKEILKKTGISVLLLVLLAILGYFLLVASFKINIPEKRYSEAVSILAEEGYHPRDSVRNGKSDYYHEIYPDILDFGTDEYIVRYSMENSDVGPLMHALIPEWETVWARYWHGYVPFLRPVFAVCSLSEARMLNAELQLLMFAILAFLAYKATGRKRYSLALLTVYAILNPSATAINFQYSSIYYAGVLSAIVLLAFKNFFLKDRRYVYLFVVSGAFTVYVDFLTYPIVAWALPAVMLFAVLKADSQGLTVGRRIWDNILHMIAATVAWIFGYIFFWMEKWTIATAFSDINVWKSALQDVLYRTGTAEGFSFLRRLKVIALNFSHLTARPFVIILLAWVLYWVVVYVRRGFVKDFKLPALAIMLFSAPAWFFMAANHTNGHHLFAWKNSLATIATMLIIICLTTVKNEVDSSERIGGNLLMRLLTLGGCMVLALGVYALVPIEELTVNNYEGSATSITLPEGKADALVMDFVPGYTKVLKVAPLIQSEDREGSVILRVYDGDKVLCTADIGVSEEIVASTDVNWRLKKGKNYKLMLSTESMNAPVTLWIDESKRLSENASSDTAIAISYTYHVPFCDKAVAAFYITEWFCLFMTFAYVIELCFLKKKAV